MALKVVKVVRFRKVTIDCVYVHQKKADSTIFTRRVPLQFIDVTDNLVIHM